KLQCFNCWQWTNTHIMRNCPNPPAPKPADARGPSPATPIGAQAGGSVNFTANNTTTNAYADVSLSLHDDELSLCRRTPTEHALLTSGKAYLDSGASSHYMRTAEGFRRVKPANSTVRTASGQPCQVNGIGEIDYGTLTLHNAKVVPELDSDLISVSQ